MIGKKNKAKEMRNKGKQYEGTGKEKCIPPRKLKPPCGEKCKYCCYEKISSERREEILKTFGLWEASKDKEITCQNA